MKTTLIIVENDQTHAEALAFLDQLMESPRAGDRARMRAQARLIEDYECVRWPRKAPSVPELLLFLMDQHDLSRADLAPLLGGASRVSEVLSGKRDLSMTMVKRLRDRFGVPADLLIPPTRKPARTPKRPSRNPRKTRGRAAA